MLHITPLTTNASDNSQEVKKYVLTKEGLPAYNPEYFTQNHLTQPQGLAFASTMSDYKQMEKLYENKDNIPPPIEYDADTHSAIKSMSDTSLDGLTKLFNRYEIPLGMISKLKLLADYKLNFIMDDSGSMDDPTDALVEDGCDHMKEVFKGRHPKSQMKRWEEAENRLHILFDFLAFIPTKGIEIRFLNRSHVIDLNLDGKSHETFAKEAHEKIQKQFKKDPEGGTPLLRRLEDAFRKSGKYMHYLFTDGEPSEALVRISDVIKNRVTKNHPLTFISCTAKASQIQWMKDLDDNSDDTAEIDDYRGEKKEVEEMQGSGFDYNYGLWVISALIAALCPHTLDALDEKIPLSKKSLEEVLGRTLLKQEYLSVYFDNHKKKNDYIHLRDLLATSDKPAKEIEKDYENRQLFKAKKSPLGMHSVVAVNQIPRTDSPVFKNSKKNCCTMM